MRDDSLIFSTTMTLTKLRKTSLKRDGPEKSSLIIINLHVGSN